MKGLRVTLIACLIFMTGCAMTNEEGGAVSGGLFGAGVGALIGDALDCQGCALLFGTAGALIGGTAGANIGRHMDEQDAARTQNAINAAPTGQRIAWNNPDTNMSYAVTPTNTYRSQQTGDYCREITIEEGTIGGKPVEAYGTACRKPDGSWESVSRQ